MLVRHGSPNAASLGMDVREDLTRHSLVVRGCRLLGGLDSSCCMGSWCLRAPA